MDNMTRPKMNAETENRCPVCQATLPSHVAPSRCPRCLLRAGLAAPPPALPETIVVPDMPAQSRGFPQPGQVFGHYRIVRPLGEGGMGAVFEAEDLECGRRVALKVLVHRLDSPEARNRFFREGRLAASVNHPNSVYVYGTEEIAGIPVIAMELAPGGTLQGRVSSQGPLPPAEAVDCVLQVIAGLEAAQRLGVLHRDVKPSNCFVEADGTVKIGDFGLSISTVLRVEPSLTASGAFLGTPAFSSPEQLRGDDLTVRSDIYAVGVTLYYLLAGHHPFTAGNVVQLMATVLERRPDSPAKWRKGLAPSLCRTVLRCLEKDPDKRFRNYDELRAALLPYATAAPTPATLGWRFLALCADLALLTMAAQLATLLNFLALAALPDPETYRQSTLWLSRVGPLCLLALNYILLEGRWGASAGKAVCGLRVAQLDGTPPAMGRAALRTLIFWVGPGLLPWLIWLVMPSWKPVAGELSPSFLLSATAGWALRALLFLTVRRRNSYAAVHDLATGTRVVFKAFYQPRPVLSAADEALPNTGEAPMIGPYHVLDNIGGEQGELLLGFDARLLRRVWIGRVAPGTPPLPASLRYLGRPGRLRWLNGQRTAAEAWDAYEAPSGRPLLALLSERQCWSRVRYWLLDLARELMAAGQDGTLPAIRDLDRVWITAEGRARMLDFPAPGTEGWERARRPTPQLASIRMPTGNAGGRGSRGEGRPLCAPSTLDPRPSPPECPTACEPGPAEAAPCPTSPDFLRQVACSALEGRAIGIQEARSASFRVPLALPARRFLEGIRADSSLAELVAALQPLLGRRPTVSRGRRLALLGGSLAFPALCAVIAAVRFGLQASFLPADKELAALQECLVHYDLLCQPNIWFGPRPHAREREALELYIAGRFAPVITNKVSWERFRTRLSMNDHLRWEAEHILATHTNLPSKEALDAAAIAVRQIIGKSPEEGARESLQSLQKVTPLLAVRMIAYINGLVFVVVPCLVASLLFRGGVLAYALGIAFVNRKGARASRLQVTGRNLFAWLPFILLPVVEGRLAAVVGLHGAILLTAGGAMCLAVISVSLPQRGLQDRLAGAWPVAR